MLFIYIMLYIIIPILSSSIKATFKEDQYIAG